MWVSKVLHRKLLFNLTPTYPSRSQHQNRGNQDETQEPIDTRTCLGAQHLKMNCLVEMKSNFSLNFPITTNRWFSSHSLPAEAKNCRIKIYSQSNSVVCAGTAASEWICLIVFVQYHVHVYGLTFVVSKSIYLSSQSSWIFHKFTLRYLSLWQIPRWLWTSMAWALFAG